MWTKGSIDGYRYQIKHFDEDSEFSINGGKISKLYMSKDGITAVNYDRGWDKRPDKAARAACEKIIVQFN